MELEKNLQTEAEMHRRATERNRGEVECCGDQTVECCTQVYQEVYLSKPNTQVLHNGPSVHEPDDFLLGYLGIPDGLGLDLNFHTGSCIS